MSPDTESAQIPASSLSLLFSQLSARQKDGGLCRISCNIVLIVSDSKRPGLTNERALLPPIWPIRGPDRSHKARGHRVDKLVTGLPSDYGPLQIDIVGPGTGAECDQSRGQESHVA